MFLHAVLLLFSFSSVCSKIASGFTFLSPGFMAFFGISFLILIIYAVLWQQILKTFSLNLAYMNKAVLIIWGMIWGYFLFGERIKWNMLLGAGLIGVGVYLMVRADE